MKSLWRGLLLLLYLLQPSMLLAASWSPKLSHSSLVFFVSHYDLADSSGRFTRYSGSFDIDPDDIEKSQAELLIDVDSLDMGDEAFTRAMLDKDWFDVEKYPQMRFVSTTVTAAADGSATVAGELSIRDQRIPITLQLRRWRCATFPLSGRYTCGYSLSGELDRMSTGMRRFKKMVGQTIELRLEFEIERENSRAGPKHKR